MSETLDGFDQWRMQHDAAVLRNVGLSPVQVMTALARNGKCSHCKGVGMFETVGFENAIIEQKCLTCAGTGYDLVGIYKGNPVARQMYRFKVQAGSWGRDENG